MSGAEQSHQIIFTTEYTEDTEILPQIPNISR